MYYIDNLELKNDKIVVKIDESDTGKVIYHDIIKIK
jgi:hypothetical protein